MGDTAESFVRGRLVFVSGTATGIGKTHFAAALLLAVRRHVARVAGIKPVESGVNASPETDSSRLHRCSSFHVKPFGYAFPEAVSPHLAARRSGVRIDSATLELGIAAARADADIVVVELAGGLFTPLGDGFLNADLAARCAPDDHLLVAPDRLGALHEVIATVRAADAMGLRIGGIVLMAPELDDAATRSNAHELTRFLSVRVLVDFPRAPVEELAGLPAMKIIVDRLLAVPGPSKEQQPPRNLRMPHRG
jgi:dethiobiotin synthetase